MSAKGPNQKLASLRIIPPKLVKKFNSLKIARQGKWWKIAEGLEKDFSEEQLALFEQTKDQLARTSHFQWHKSKEAAELSVAITPSPLPLPRKRRVYSESFSLPVIEKELPSSSQKRRKIETGSQEYTRPLLGVRVKKKENMAGGANNNNNCLHKKRSPRV